MYSLWIELGYKFHNPDLDRLIFCVPNGQGFKKNDILRS